MKKNISQKIHEFIVKKISKVNWKSKKQLTKIQKDIIRELLAGDYYIIATRKDNQLSTFFINLAHFMFSGRWGYYTHVLMNLEDEAKLDSDFRLIEATTHGTKYSTFDEVFSNIQAVALIKAHDMSVIEWTECMDNLKSHLGKPYDNLFNIKNNEEINCVELVRLALQYLPNYSTRFFNFEKLISCKPTITPQMIIECQDFHIYHKFKI